MQNEVNDMTLDYVCPPRNKYRTVIVLSKDCEIEDKLALAHQLLSPKFEVEGIVAYGKGGTGAIKKFLALMRLEKYTVLEGDNGSGEPSEGARFIAERAMAADERPLYVAAYGALTDAARAVQLCPETEKTLTVVWCGGAAWPCGGRERHLEEDVDAANYLMASQTKLWQLPDNVYGQIKLTAAEAMNRVGNAGAQGRYFAEEIKKRIDKSGSNCLEIPGEAVVGAMINPFDHSYDCLPAPHINHQMYYVRNQYRRPVRVYYFIDSRMMLEDFYSKMSVLYADGEGEQG